MTKIKGYLRDGASKLITNAAIILSAKKTSNNVLEKNDTS